MTWNDGVDANASFAIELSYRQQLVNQEGSWLMLSFRYFIH